MIRVGIDLSRTTCTVVELYLPRTFLQRGPAVPTQLKSVHVLPVGSERPGDLVGVPCAAERDARHAWAGVWASRRCPATNGPPGLTGSR
jgi:hypothetical protein